MATIDELERHATEIRAAESEAVGKLIDCMRELAVGLPDGSRLAPALAATARRLEKYTRPGIARYAMNEMVDLEHDLGDES